MSAKRNELRDEIATALDPITVPNGVNPWNCADAVLEAMRAHLSETLTALGGEHVGGVNTDAVYAEPFVLHDSEDGCTDEGACLPVWQLRAAVRERITFGDQTALAAHLDISEKHLSQMLTGKADGSFGMWDALCRALRVDLRITLEPWDGSGETP